MLAYLNILKWDESKHPRDKDGQFIDSVGTIRGQVRSTADQAHRDMLALGKRIERMEKRQGVAADKARAAWATWAEATKTGRKKPLKPDGAAAKKLPEYKAALAADEEVHRAWEELSRVKGEMQKEALRQLLVPVSERSKVKFLVPKGQIHADPRIEEAIANGSARALNELRKYDGSGQLVSPPFPADRVEKVREVLGPEVELDIEPDGSARIAKRLRLTRAPAGTRANATPFGVQVGGTRDLERTIWHEVAHHIEFASEEIYNAAVEVRSKLATDQTPKTLNEIKGSSGYGADEVAVVGRFLEQYSGKVYPSEARATEMISTGVEFYLSDPIRFAREAPEHFKLIWDVMHGKYKRHN